MEFSFSENRISILAYLDVIVDLLKIDDFVGTLLALAFYVAVTQNLSTIHSLSLFYVLAFPAVSNRGILICSIKSFSRYVLLSTLSFSFSDTYICIGVSFALSYLSYRT